MSSRRFSRKQRPPWIQTQLDQGYRPYSFYVEYQQTTPLVRAPATGKPEVVTPDDRTRAAGPTRPEAASGVLAPPADRSAPADRRQDAGQIWYRTGAAKPIGTRHQNADGGDDDDGRVTDPEAARSPRRHSDGTQIGEPRQRGKPIVDGTARIEADRAGNTAARTMITQSDAYDGGGGGVPSPSDDGTASESTDGRAVLTTASSATASSDASGGKVRLENPGIASPVTNGTLTASNKTETQMDATGALTVTNGKLETTADRLTERAGTVTESVVSYDDVMGSDHVSGQWENSANTVFSDIPRESEEPKSSVSDVSTQSDLGLSGYGADDTPTGVSAYNVDYQSSTIPRQSVHTSAQNGPSTVHEGVTTDVTVTTTATASTSTATTTTHKQPDIVICSTKHHSKTKTTQHVPKAPRRRNRNRKRTKPRRPAQTSAPPSLSMGYGLLSTQKQPLYPLSNPSNPQAYITQPTLTAPAGGHSFAQNSTFTISGLTSAEVTGIAIGCIIAFWIILGPLVCIICRMRDKAKEKRREREQEDSMSHTLIEEMIRMELARGRAKLYRTNVDDEREIERLPLQGDCCNTCNGNGSCIINPQDYVIGNRYMEYTPVSLTVAPAADSDKEYIINKTYMDSLDTKRPSTDTNL